MNESNTINLIKDILRSKYIGDDCAFLKELGIVITHDSLVEGVHFDRKTISMHQLGYKSIMVNLSDIAASGAKPCYITLSLSLPKEYKDEDVAEFYEGCKKAIKDYEVEIVGGDLTGSDKIFVSVCAIGETENRKISSRSNACVGHKIITSGVHGSSAAGLEILTKNLEPNTDLINAHLMPTAQIEFSTQISTQINCKYAMMDTSDGLFDALYKIGTSSNCTMSIDFEKISYNHKIKKYFKNYKDFIFYGGEDYQIIATVPALLLPKLKDYTIIGEVIPFDNSYINLNHNGIVEKIISLEDKCYNHFG